MEEILETGANAADKIAESVVEDLDLTNLKYLAAFGAGAVVGIVAYRKVLAPAWAKYLNWKHRPKYKTVPPTEEGAEDDLDEEPE